MNVNPIKLIRRIRCKIADWFTPEPRKSSGLLKPNLFKVEYHKIRFFTTKNVIKNNVKLVTIDDQIYYDKGCLQDVINECDYFVRVSKQYVVNLNDIDSRQEWSLCWSGEYKFKITRSFRSSVKKKMEEYFAHRNISL